jgi:hypothetical protein
VAQSWWSAKPRILVAYDNRMTLAIYAHATDGMEDSAPEALEEAFS